MKKKTGANKATFKIPSFGAGAAIVYGAPGLTENGGVPNITGGYGLACNGSESSPATMWYGYGAFYQETISTRKVGSSGNSATAHGLAFDASRISSVYNNSTKVYASGLKMRFIIKY